MSQKKDASLSLAMSARRPPATVKAEMATTPFGHIAAEARDATLIPISLIDRSPFQSRGKLDSEKIEALVAMIKTDGLITPIIVRNIPGGRYENVTGHRRTEAFRRLGRPDIPAVVRDMSDKEAAIALTADNTGHAGLTDWETCKHIRMLRDHGFEAGASELARVIGCSRQAIYRFSEFEKMPLEVQAMLDEAPSLIGGNLAYDMRDFSISRPALVIEAVTLLSQAKIKQSGIMGWLKRKTTERLEVERHEYEYSFGKVRVKMVSKDNDTKITGAINAKKLHALIEANLKDLVAESQGDE